MFLLFELVSHSVAHFQYLSASKATVKKKPLPSDDVPSMLSKGYHLASSNQGLPASLITFDGGLASSPTHAGLVCVRYVNGLCAVGGDCN